MDFLFLQNDQNARKAWFIRSSSMSIEPSLITILGVHLKSEGYPNVTYRIQALCACASLRVNELNHPFRSDPITSRTGSGGFAIARVVRKSFKFVYAHLNVLVRYLFSEKTNVVYVPYPAVLLLLMFSFVPRTLRPHAIVIDAFISIYDTIVNDRKLVNGKGILGRLIWWLENRAYSVAEVIVVDTQFNAEYMNETFPALRTREVLALPLSIDESFFCAAAKRERDSTCNVLFVGTFVPLQGVETIAKAAALLADREDIHIRLVGNGQTADAVRKILLSYDRKNIDWIVDWQSKEQIRNHIEEADICLGIFGGGDKTQRVWPFKNYHYMAVGRAIITADTKCARHLTASADGGEPFLTVPCEDSEALANEIRHLANSPGRRMGFANAARKLYFTTLCSTKSVEQLANVLTRLSRKDI
jgi:glycosyltransferase involved in cell wall biosynthesis